MQLDRYGAAGDRRFIVVDEQNRCHCLAAHTPRADQPRNHPVVIAPLPRFVTQRQEADMALLKASVDTSNGVLTLEAPGAFSNSTTTTSALLMTRRDDYPTVVDTS